MKYSRLQVMYHWLTAALIVVMAATGLAYSYDLAGKPAINMHQIAGQALVLLLLARLAARLTRRTPSAPSNHQIWERYLAQFVHIGLYLCLVAFVITGYVSASALRDTLLIAPVDLTFARSDTGERFLETHFLLKWVLLGLVILHVAGALKHQFWDRDNTFSNMTLNPIKEPQNAKSDS